MSVKIVVGICLYARLTFIQELSSKFVVMESFREQSGGTEDRFSGQMVLSH
jgi:hypothetical protein